MVSLDVLKNPNKYPQLMLVLLSFFPILNIKLLSIFSLLFFVISIFFNLKNIKNNFKAIGYKPLIINTLFYILIVVSLLYSPFKSRGADLLIREISVLLIPLILIYAIKISKKLIKIMTLIFIISNLAVVIFFVFKLNLISDFITYPKTFFNTRYFLLIYETDYKDWHPTYIAINNLFSSIILLDYILKPKKPVKFKALASLAILVFVLFSLILNSRIIFFLTLIVIPFYLFFKIKKLKYRLIILFTILVSCFTLFKVSNSNKLGRIFEHPIQHYVNNFSAKTILGFRHDIQTCSIELIERKPILGYGIGYEKNLLSNYCLETKNFSNRQLTNYSSHNVYLSIIFTSGIFALIAFIAMLINNVTLGIKRKDLLQVSFLLIFIIAFLTENYLVRLNGVLLFAFINSYFYQKNYQKN